MSGIAAFKEAYMSVDVLDETDFADPDARRLRYQIYWGFYENTVYRDLVHKWARQYRASYGLYKYIRNIYNPSYRIGEFWKTHLWGGELDPKAGDGKGVPSALPIATDSETLRTAIAQLWKWSNWQVNKDIITLYGSVMGDVAIRIVDDPARKKVYLRKVHPGTIKDVTKDEFGNIKGYFIQYERKDPDNLNRMVVYTEECSRKDGDPMVYYKTCRNGTPFSWDETAPEWSEPYGFVPMVLIQHNNLGLDWGWSELHPARSKFHEVDDLGSKLSDQIRKIVDAPWLFAGVNAPKKDVTMSGATATPDRPEPGREEIPALYGPVGATAIPLVAPLQIADTSAHIATILKEIERDYPELSVDINNIQGDISGRALRIHQQPASIKVQQRRANYDDALVRAQQMAIAIGGMRAYEGFAGFSLDSYESGQLDHSISNRPVFAKDPLDDLDMEEVLWKVAALAKNVGVGPLVFLKRQGWTDEQLKEIEDNPEYKARMDALKNISAMNAAGTQANGGGKPFGAQADKVAASKVAKTTPEDANAKPA